MITEEEARELVNLFNVTVNASNKFYHKSSAYLEIVEAAERVRGKLGDFAIQELARRESEQIEHGKPVDAEWLVYLGFTHDDANGEWFAEFCGVSVIVKDNLTSWSIGYSGEESPSTWQLRTRGQLLYLLKALKGGES